MFRLKITIVIVLLLLLFSTVIIACNKNNKNKIAKPIQSQYIDEITVTGEHKLQTPKRTISSREDFVYALDYMRFYMISNYVKFLIGKEYKSKISSIHYEYDIVSQLSDIAELSPNNLDYSQFETESIIKIKIREGKFAIKPNMQDKSKDFAKNIDYLDVLNNKTTEFNDFYADKYDKKLNVENSEQLYYAVQNGYRPIVASGSIAEKIYGKGKKILRRILEPNMSEFQKAKQIFNYLTTEIQYDYAVLKDAHAGNIEPYAYYLEGVFLTQSAVCDGRSKAYVLLLAMAGIESKRVTAKDDEGNGHAYNYVKINSKWYLSCTTYGQVNDNTNQLNLNNSLIYSRYNMLYTTKDTELGVDLNGKNAWKYKSLKHMDIYEKIETNMPKLSEYQFKNQTELQTYLNNRIDKYIDEYKNGEYPKYITMQVEVKDGELDTDLIENLNTSEVTLRVIKNRSTSTNLYTVFFQFG